VKRLLVLIAACGTRNPPPEPPPTIAPVAPPVSAIVAPGVPLDAAPAVQEALVVPKSAVDAPKYKLVFDGIEGCEIAALGFDANHNLYIAGDAEKLTVKTKKFTNKHQRFLAKAKPDGSVEWIVPVGEKTGGQILAMAVAADGTVAVTGWYQSSVGPGPMKHTRLDSFVAVIGSDGKQRWHALIDGAQREMLDAIHIAKDGAVLVAGSFEGEVKIGKQNVKSVPGKYVYSVDMLVVRYEPDGRLAWAANAGGPEDDGATSITTAANGDVIVGGEIGRNAIFGPTLLEGPPEKARFANPTYAFVAAYTSTGQLKWAAQHGRFEETTVKALVPLADGGVLAYGPETDESDLNNGRNDKQFVIRIDATGKPAMMRDVSHAGAIGFADGAIVLAMWPDGGRLHFEHQGVGGTRPAGSIDIPASGHPLAFARGADGRVAVAVRVGELKETPMNGNRISVSSAELDSVVATAAGLEQLDLR
jgi:hypothetical protein